MGTGGSAVDPSAQLLIGNWIYLGATCASALDFTDSEYSLGEICPLASGETGLSVETGAYSVNGNRITFSPVKSTCAEASKVPAGATFSVTRTTLTVGYADALVAYELNTASAMGGTAATLGCFRNGIFTASPLAPL
jgi:hypothetical protein